MNPSLMEDHSDRRPYIVNSEYGIENSHRFPSIAVFDNHGMIEGTRH